VSFTAGVVLFALAIGLSVAIHEFGHLLTAKAFGMKARRYFIGFGPKLWSFQRGETEYGLKAIPAGGFVDIEGFAHTEELAKEDGPRAFWRFPAWQRLIVLVAGSFTHFIIAFVVLYCTAISLGLPTSKPLVAGVTTCVPSANADGTLPDCAAGDDSGPAYQAGLKKGDEIVAVDGKPVTSFTDLSTMLRAMPGQQVTITYLRDGVKHTVPMTVPAVKRPAIGDEVADANGNATVGAIGVEAATLATRNPVAAFGATASFTGTVLDATFGAIGRFPDKVPGLIDALQGQQRDPDGPVSVVGASRIGGEAVEAGSWLFFLFLLASFNIFIGVFNLFPLLPLDGGHVAVLLFEKARTAIARLRRRADPGHVDLAKLMPVTFVVILIFGGISVLTILADVVNPIANPFQ
jgi:membrane-associated protease RseP (regulator of RpoE activity)